MISGGSSGWSEWFGGYEFGDDTILGPFASIRSLFNPAIMNYEHSSVSARSSFSFLDYISRTYVFLSRI
jgi:hypothetical protein